MQPLLAIEDLHWTQGERHILAGLDLSMAKGEVHVLLGANGAGKSSLAYAIMGCEGYRASSGRILFEGEPIDDEPLYRRARRGIVLAWQEPARFEGLSVQNFLSLGDARKSPKKCLQAVGLEPVEYLDRPLDRTLSGGERKRIELASILALEPKLAILDEPAAGIDLRSLDEITGLIDRLKQAGSAVLVITHREDIAGHADCASQLSGGRIVCHGPPARVIDNYKRRRCHRCDGETCHYE